MRCRLSTICFSFQLLKVFLYDSVCIECAISQILIKISDDFISHALDNFHHY